MPTPRNGADVIIRVQIPDSVGYLDVAFQKDVAFDVTNKLIDVSNKTSGRRSLNLLGRLDEEVTLDMFWSEETSYQILRDAARNGDAVTIIRAFDDDGDGSYDNVESCEALITKMNEKFPDQEGAMVNITFHLSGDWTAIP